MHAARFPLTPFSAAGLLLSGLVFATRPAAATAALTLNQPGIQDTESASYSIGWEFQTNSVVTINALGYYANSPLNYSHGVGIFDTSGNLLVSGIVPSGGTGGSFQYVSVAPATLASGQDYYVMAASGPSQDPDTFAIYDTTGAPGFSTAAAITYVSAAYNNQSVSESPLYPNGSDTAPIYGLFGPNFQFTAADASLAPEPSQVATLSMLGLGLAALMLRAHKRQAA